MDAENLNRFDRIVALLIHLQSRRVVKAQEIAERFDVSLRTVYRDIRSLEASGVPIIGEAGVGYSIVDGYRLPPVMFSREEASAFVAAEKLMQSFSDERLRNHFTSAMYKVKSVLRESSKEHVEALESQILINPTEELFNKNTPDALEVLLDAMGSKTQVDMDYLSAHDESSARTIEPINLIHENNFWYAIAFCHLREDYRQFRIDRISKIRRTELSFTREHLSAEEIRNSQVSDSHLKVVIRVTKDTIRYLKSGRKYYGFVSEEDRGDIVEMTFLAPDPPEGLARWYLMFGDQAEIVEPESFRTLVMELLDTARGRILS